MSRTLAKRSMWVILICFVLLSAVYSVVNPVFEAPDEVYHYPYIKHVADGRWLPVQNAEQPELWSRRGANRRSTIS